MSLVLQSSGGGQITIQEPATASNFTQTLPAATGTVALLQTPAFATTIGVGGATASASGSGITFPSTQSASTDANTLDDYEEGTFTPTIEGTSTAGTATYSTQQGNYVKIGKEVHLQIFLTLTSTPTGTGGTKIGGFPFTSATFFGAGGSVPYKTSFVTNGPDFMQTEANTTFGYLRYSNGTGQGDINPSVNMQNGTGFMVNISYIANA
jgi:hypothetical protein